MTAPRRPVSAAAAALILGIVTVAVLVVVLIARRAGPLVAHPPTAEPRPPPAITVPSMPALTATTPPAARQAASNGDWLWWVLGVLAGLVALAILMWLIRALCRPHRPAPGPAGATAGAQLDAVIGALAEQPEVDLGDDRTFDARRAADDIIASWSAVERAAALAGRPRPESSTPTEFLQLLAGVMGDPPPRDARGAADALLGLYHHARFDTAVLAPGSATAARAAARMLVGAMRERRHV